MNKTTNAVVSAAPATSSVEIRPYHLNRLVEAVNQLVICHEIPHLSGVFSDFVYFLSHPDCIHEFEKQDIIDHATECINLLGRLSDVYEWYHELQKHLNHD